MFNRELSFFTGRGGRLFVGRARIFWGGLREGLNFYRVKDRGQNFFLGPRGAGTFGATSHIHPPSCFIYTSCTYIHTFIYYISTISS